MAGALPSAVGGHSGSDSRDDASRESASQRTNADPPPRSPQATAPQTIPQTFTLSWDPGEWEHVEEDTDSSLQRWWSQTLPWWLRPRPYVMLMLGAELAKMRLESTAHDPSEEVRHVSRDDAP